MSVVALTLIGCGGNGGTANNPSPFRGTYSGTIARAAGGNVLVNWTISSTGYINGNDNNGGTVGIDTGFVDKAGMLRVTSKATGFPNILYQANVSISALNGDLIGTGTETESGASDAINLELVLQ